MKSIDDFINYEEEYKKYLQKSRKNGNSLIAKCPFHQDDKPSFSVDLINGKYHCFGCIDFHRTIHHITWCVISGK